MKNKLKELIDKCKQDVIFIMDYDYNKDDSVNIINANKIVLDRKEKEYPKTYDECLSVLKIKGYDIITYVPSWTEYEKALYQEVLKLRELIICRDAYWKIAGDEMGLGKPWEPDYKNPDIDLYVIINIYNRVEKAKYGYGFQHCVFTFPTEEMRDAFENNFGTDLEICKEFL